MEKSDKNAGSSRENFQAIIEKQQQEAEKFKKSLEAAPNKKTHISLEETLKKSEQILASIKEKLQKLAEFSKIEIEDVFNEPWEEAILKELYRSYLEISIVSENSGEEILPNLEIGLMHAENLLIQDLTLSESIINDEIKKIILKDSTEALKSIEEKENTQSKLEKLLLKVVKYSAMEQSDNILDLEKEFQNLIDGILPAEKEKNQELISMLNKNFETVKERHVKTRALHVLNITREQLLLSKDMAEFFEKPGGLEKVGQAFNVALQGIIQPAKYIGTGAFLKPAAEIYDMPSTFPTNDRVQAIEKRIILVASLEESILSGKAKSIEDAINSRLIPESKDIKKFSEYLKECEKIPERLYMKRQNHELSQLFDYQKKYDQKRNIMAKNFEEAIFKKGPATFEFEFEGTKEKITVSSLNELDIFIEKYLYTSHYPQLINALSKKARSQIDEDSLVATMRETIWNSWGFKERMTDDDKKEFLQNRDLERLLKSAVNSVVDFKIEQNVKNLLKDQMLKQLVFQNQASIRTAITEQSGLKSFESYLDSGFTELKSFNLSDELSDRILGEVSQMAIMYSMMKICMIVPRKAVDSLIKPLEVGGKLIRSTTNTVSYAIFSQVIDNMATILLFNAHLTPGQWSLGLATRSYYELWSCGIYRGIK